MASCATWSESTTGLWVSAREPSEFDLLKNKRKIIVNNLYRSNISMHQNIPIKQKFRTLKKLIRTLKLNK